MFTDFKPKFICKFDHTFWLHLIRDAIICGLGCLLDVKFGVGLALGVDLAWEWQDGLHNDGFNLLDFLAGLIGIFAGFEIIKMFIGN